MGIFPSLDRDALGRANRGAQVAGNAFGFVVGNIQCVQSPEAGGNYGPLGRILQSDRLFEQMAQRDFQTMQYWCNRIHNSILVFEVRVWIVA
jgi:hypothetical protein